MPSNAIYTSSFHFEVGHCFRRSRIARTMGAAGERSRTAKFLANSHVRCQHTYTERSDLVLYHQDLRTRIGSKPSILRAHPAEGHGNKRRNQ
jgi:hypothetical protein